MHTVQGMDGQTENMTVDLSEAGLGQENQLIITGEDGHGYPVSVSGMITVPMSSMYQMVANIQHLTQNGDGTVCLTPIQVSNAGGSNQPSTKYHMLKAAVVQQPEGGGGGTIISTTTTGQAGSSCVSAGSNGTIVLGANGLVNGKSERGTIMVAGNHQAGTSPGGQISTGLASLFDVIQLQLKNELDEDNDCNNNGRSEGDGEEEESVANGDGGDLQVKCNNKVEYVNVGDGNKRFVLQVKQK